MGHDKNIGDCLIDDYLTYDEDESIVIDNGSSNTWEFEQYIIGDLVIENSSSLTIKCQIYMSPGGTVEVEDGSTLVLDGGTITNANVHVYDGGTFNVYNDGKLELNSNDEVLISNGAISNFDYGSIDIIY